MIKLKSFIPAIDMSGIPIHKIVVYDRKSHRDKTYVQFLHTKHIYAVKNTNGKEVLQQLPNDSPRARAIRKEIQEAQQNRQPLVKA